MSGGILSFKFIGALYSALIVPVVYLRWQSRDKRAENEAFLRTHGLVAPEEERQRAITHLMSGDAIRVDSNEHFEGSRNCLVVRKRVAQQAKGSVLEIGIGTGEHSIPQLMRNTKVASLCGIDNHSVSLAVCEDTCSRNASKEITLVRGRAEELPFSNNSFDTVISQFSLCSIEDPVKAVQEMARVAKNRIVILEHGLSYWSVVRWLGYWTSMFPDPQHPWSYGCYQNRDVLDIIKESGVKIQKLNTSSLGHVYLIQLVPTNNNQLCIDTPTPNVVYRSPHS